MNLFEETTLRLKQQLKVTEDKQVAEILGMTGNAWTMRKRRSSFPETELYALAAKRPDLGIDVDYVLTGTTETESLRQRDALHAAGGVSAAQRAAHRQEVELLSNYRACSPEDQAMVFQLLSRLTGRKHAA